MSADLEGRLRAALEAYARIADDDARARRAAGPPTGRPDVRTARGPRPRVSRWAPVVVAAAVLLVVGGVWFLVARPGQPPPSVAAVSSSPSAAGPAPSASRAQARAVPGASGHPGAATLPASPAIGVAYVFDLSTHCGIRGAALDGVWFAAQPPQVSDGGNPPPGWDNPEQRGTLTLLSGSTAVFRDDAGHVVRMVAAPQDRPPPCD
ncbi:MAG: hypothetical protein JWO98_18 [Frankiales bacterium]|nr:hypothetical protein [Frankiales bacterium]